MKNISKISALALLAIVTISCNKDLTIIQKGAVSTNEAWETQEDAQSCMYGMIAKSRGAFSSLIISWGDIRTGAWGFYANAVASFMPLMENNIHETDRGTDWSSLYNTINLANVILKHTPDIKFSNTNLEKSILGSAYFIRASCYYWIARVWGDAPLITEGLESYDIDLLYPTRSPKTEIFALVASDLEEAGKYLEGVSAQPNMPNIDAVNALKTDYYLWMYKVEKDNTALAKARTACNAVIGKHSLLPSFADVFSTSNKNNDEVIFAYSMKKDEKEYEEINSMLCGISEVAEVYLENPVKAGSHSHALLITKEYRDLLNSVIGDSRRDATYGEFYDDISKRNLQWMNKFQGTWLNGERVFDTDLIMYRYADILMYDAEIKCEENNLSGAIASINQIAKRAYGKDNFYSAGKSKAEVLDIILLERKKEFLGEGKLWWDFQRLGVVFDEVATLKGRQNNKNILYWPVNQTSLNQNTNLKQTEIEY